jgi:hypothetical protein
VPATVPENVGEAIVGDVPSTTLPVPVRVEKSVNPASQSAAVVRVVPIQVQNVVTPAGRETIALDPLLCTLTTPVELLII